MCIKIGKCYLALSKQVNKESRSLDLNVDCSAIRLYNTQHNLDPAFISRKPDKRQSRRITVNQTYIYLSQIQFLDKYSIFVPNADTFILNRVICIQE